VTRRRLPAAAALALVLGGCSAAVEAPIPTPLPSGADYLCAALKGALPDEVLGQTTTATKPTSSFATAWGDPAIVVRCGVPDPQALTPTSQLLTVDGVDWLPEQLTSGYLFTSTGRTINVEVSVPAAYAPEASALPEISPAVAGVIPPVTD
jgi:hypothetical protein